MKLVDSFYSTFNHDTYYKIKTYNQVLWNALAIGNILAPSMIFLPFYTISSTLFILLSVDNSYEYKARDIKEIRKLYDEFIINYNKLNKTFSFNNPVEIYALFNYLYTSGYLSKDKVFEIGSDEVRDNFSIMGSNVFMGKGVCRHLSILLTDILNNYGIPTNYLPCFMGHLDVEIEMIKKEDFNIEETLECLRKIKELMDVDTEELAKNLIEKDVPIKIKLVCRKTGNDIAMKYGNHAICYSEYQGLNYFLDPTNELIYDYKDGRLVDSSGLEGDIKVPSGLMEKIIKKLGYSPLEEIKEQSCLAKEERDKLLFKVNKICLNNLDIFEHFYNENKELYEEVTSKLVRIRK